MSKVMDFDSIDKFNTYIMKKYCDSLGSGSEGCCYKGNDGKAYKCIDYDEGFFCSDYNIDKIITTSDVTNESFAFPQILFTVGDDFVGYTSELVEPDLFDDYFFVTQNTIDHIDFDKLIKAYYKMEKDVLLLTNNSIKIYDLPYNLLFDGERLVGIDTCCFSYDESISLEENIGSLDMAIKQAFYMFLSTRGEDECTSFYKEHNDKTPEEFLRILESRYKSDTKNRVYVNKKSSN